MECSSTRRDVARVLATSNVLGSGLRHSPFSYLRVIEESLNAVGGRGADLIILFGSAECPWWSVQSFDLFRKRVLGQRGTDDWFVRYHVFAWAFPTASVISMLALQKLECLSTRRDVARALSRDMQRSHTAACRKPRGDVARGAVWLRERSTMNDRALDACESRSERRGVSSCSEGGMPRRALWLALKARTRRVSASELLALT
jgi:hypothetical protein